MNAAEPVLCVVEIPKGSRNKYEHDEDTGGIRLERFLFSSVVYPMDYGYVPDTLAEDGDPLDVMICVSAPTFPGCRIYARPIALFRMTDEKGQDDKLLGVPISDPQWSHMESLDDLPSQMCDEIAHFFSIYKQPEGHEVDVQGWATTDEALRVLEHSRRRFGEGAG
jgi:inorganic pyrophosphatase